MKLVYGLDLGSSSIKICKKDSVIELKESSVIEKITNDDGTFSYGLAGNDIDKYYQKNQNSELIYPIKSGIVVDKDALIELLTRFFNKLIPKKSIFQKIEFYVLAECGLTVEQYNEIREICYKVGACKVSFLPSAICAIYGYDLELSQFENFCLADLGADTAKFYLCSKHSVIKGLSINCAGNAIDEFLGIHALKMENLILDKKEKEALKLNVASIMETNNATYTANGINSQTLVKDSHTDRKSVV